MERASRVVHTGGVVADVPSLLQLSSEVNVSCSGRPFPGTPVIRWLKETKHKATHAGDVAKLRWRDRYLRGKALEHITRDLLSGIADTKARESSTATANRYMALVRAILRKAMHEWEWVDRVPKVRMLHEAKRRVRWLTPPQAVAG